jgi:hypothetical protein
MIVKKLRITEEQFNRIHKYLVETKFNNVIKDTVKPGDIIRITYGNVTSNFKAINNTQGQIQMDNIDSGSTNINYRYFISQTSLAGNELEIRRVHKLKEKDKLTDVKLWKQMEVKGITNIEVLRDNQVIDTVDKPKPNVKGPASEPTKVADSGRMTPDDYALLENVKDELLSLKELHTVTFDLVDGTKILFCATAKNHMTYELEVANITGDIAKYDVLRKNRLQMHFNESINQDYLDDILYKKGNDIRLLLNIIKGEELIRYNLHFTKVQVGGACSDVSDGESEDEKQKEIEDGKETMDAILADPRLKKAFYSQPSLWDLFKAEITGKKAIGTGYITVNKIVNDYEKKKVGDKLSTILEPGKTYKFKFLNHKEVKIGNLRISKGSKDIGMYQIDSEKQHTLKAKGYQLIFKKSTSGLPPDNKTHYDCTITDDYKEETRNISIRLILNEK